MNDMSKYIPESVLDEVEKLKNQRKFDEAMKMVNSILSEDPHNEDALLQVADIYYRS
jgi:DNA-binding SARP family transcriptional activator